MGVCIAALEKAFNRPNANALYGRVVGVVALSILLALVLSITLAIERYGTAWLIIPCMAMLLASRSLMQHVRAVYSALIAKDLAQAREKVARIVGRDVSGLDEAGVARAAIESLAESFCDGVVAPVFWGVCFGLPGIACYKAINTADSMIGHKDARHRFFGWAAARVDDVANFIPARISGALIALVSCSFESWQVMWVDARKHASPNAGWPEAAMAGALGLCLAGAQLYDGVVHEAALIGHGTRNATTRDLRRAMQMTSAATLALWITLILAWQAIVAFQ